MNKNPLKRFRNKHSSVRALYNYYHDLSQWFDTDSGQRLLNDELCVLNDVLSTSFGYHLLSFSIVPNKDITQASLIKHKFNVASSSNVREGVSLYLDVAHWPIQSHSLDVVVLHHVLDYSKNPQGILKEAQRVLRPGGKIVVIGFNPITMAPLVWFRRAFRAKPFWLARPILLLRLMDWASFLELNVESLSYVNYQLPGQDNRITRVLNRLLHPVYLYLERRQMPLGNAFVWVAKNEPPSLTPLDLHKLRVSRFTRGTQLQGAVGKSVKSASDN